MPCSSGQTTFYYFDYLVQIQQLPVRLFLLTFPNQLYMQDISIINYPEFYNEAKLNEHLQSEEYNVYILGHSCGISDGLILSQIFNSQNIHQIIPFYFKDRMGYFDTMVNVDRIIDDYSKEKSSNKSFEKLISFPNSHPMPQREDDELLVDFLKNIVDNPMPLENRRIQSAKASKARGAAITSAFRKN